MVCCCDLSSENLVTLIIKLEILWPCHKIIRLFAVLLNSRQIIYCCNMLIFLKQTDNNISDDIMKFLSYCVTFFVLYLYFVKGEISEGDKELIRKWMPIYWLHSEEV